MWIEFFDVCITFHFYTIYIFINLCIFNFDEPIILCYFHSEVNQDYNIYFKLMEKIPPYLFDLEFFYWRTIGLQYCVSFCHTTTQISHKYISIPSLLNISWSSMFKQYCLCSGGFLVAQSVKNPPSMWETWVWNLGWEDPLEKGMATQSSIIQKSLYIECYGK